MLYIAIDWARNAKTTAFILRVDKMVMSSSFAKLKPSRIFSLLRDSSNWAMDLSSGLAATLCAMLCYTDILIDLYIEALIDCEAYSYFAVVIAPTKD